MPNWSDENGRYWYIPKNKAWYERIEIPHAPVIVIKNCNCIYCLENKKVKKNKK